MGLLTSAMAALDASGGEADVAFAGLDFLWCLAHGSTVNLVRVSYLLVSPSSSLSVDFVVGVHAAHAGAADVRCGEGCARVGRAPGRCACRQSRAWLLGAAGHGHGEQGSGIPKHVMSCSHPVCVPVPCSSPCCLHDRRGFARYHAASLKQSCSLLLVVRNPTTAQPPSLCCAGAANGCTLQGERCVRESSGR
jgi:hypothetical protein